MWNIKPHKVHAKLSAIPTEYSFEASVLTAADDVLYLLGILNPGGLQLILVSSIIIGIPSIHSSISKHARMFIYSRNRSFVFKSCIEKL